MILNLDPQILLKVDSPNTQIYLPDTLILYSMNDTLRISASYDPRGYNNQILDKFGINGHWVNYTLRNLDILGCE